MKRRFALFAILALLLAGASLAGRVMDSNTTTFPRAPDKPDVCQAAQQFVKRSLKAPTTANFPACDAPGVMVKSQAIRAGDHWSPTSHTVTGYVDSQNSFGAMLRSTYTVQMLYDPGSRKWHLQKLTFVP